MMKIVKIIISVLILIVLFFIVVRIFSIKSVQGLFCPKVYIEDRMPGVSGVKRSKPGFIFKFVCGGYSEAGVVY